MPKLKQKYPVLKQEIAKLSDTGKQLLDLRIHATGSAVNGTMGMFSGIVIASISGGEYPKGLTSELSQLEYEITTVVESLLKSRLGLEAE